MSGTLRVKVTLDPAYVTLNKDDYREDYIEACDDDGEDPADEVPDEFVLEKYQQQVEDGNDDLAAIFETAAVSVEKAST